MFLWVRAVLLPPEAQVVHEGRGNQERQQYQENPVKKEHSGDVTGEQGRMSRWTKVPVSLWCSGNGSGCTHSWSFSSGDSVNTGVSLSTAGHRARERSYQYQLTRSLPVPSSQNTYRGSGGSRRSRCARLSTGSLCTLRSTSTRRTCLSLSSGAKWGKTFMCEDVAPSIKTIFNENEILFFFLNQRKLNWWYGLERNGKRMR